MENRFSRQAIFSIIMLLLLGALLWYSTTISQNKENAPITATPTLSPSPTTTVPSTPTSQPSTSPKPTIITPTPRIQDLITITSPLPNQLITSPLALSGQARGNWFFEASAPVRLLDGNGQQIAITIITAQGEWMTTNFVPFTGQLTFEAPDTATGQVVFEKDNPSGLPENAREIRIPIRFR